MQGSRKNGHALYQPSARRDAAGAVFEACKKLSGLPVSVGLKQLDEGTGVYDIPGLLEESMENAWLTVRTARLRKVICYAANTLNAASVLVILLMQLRIWIQR